MALEKDRQMAIRKMAIRIKKFEKWAKSHKLKIKKYVGDKFKPFKEFKEDINE